MLAVFKMKPREEKDKKKLEMSKEILGKQIIMSDDRREKAEKKEKRGYTTQTN